jgi:4-oxalocrotonate tautomerase
MPYINVQILEGATTAQKRALVADITRSLVMRLGKKPEHIHIVIDEVKTDNWGYAGELTTEFLQRTRPRAKKPSATGASMPGRKKPRGTARLRS